MDMNELISIVIPIYGVEKYLRQCLDSVINQTYKDLEIILVDDGSTDGSPGICDEYAAKDSRIVVIHKENGGRVSARKVGVQKAHGVYTVYVDGDDWISLDYVEELYKSASQNSADMVICTCVNEGKERDKEKLYFTEGKYNRKQLETIVFPKMIFTGRFDEFGIRPHVYKMYKTVLLKEYQKDVPDEICLGEDAALVYPMLLACENIFILDKAIYHYRFNDKGITLKYNRMIPKSSIILNRYLRGKMPEEYTTQLDFYHCLMALTNAVNVARGGMNRGFGIRMRNLEEFYRESDLHNSISRCNFDSVHISIIQRIGIKMMHAELYRTMVIFYWIKYKLGGGLKQKRHG